MPHVNALRHLHHHCLDMRTPISHSGEGRIEELSGELYRLNMELMNEFVHVVHDEANLVAAMSALLQANGKREQSFHVETVLSRFCSPRFLRLPHSRSQDDGIGGWKPGS